MACFTGIFIIPRPVRSISELQPVKGLSKGGYWPVGMGNTPLDAVNMCNGPSYYVSNNQDV